MATAESASKICMVCGKDVAGQPRVKDAMGRYLCAGECQQKALAASKAREEARAAKPPNAPPGAAAKTPAPPPMEPGGLMGQLIADSPMLKSATCESCGNPMPGGAVLCTRCGFNISTGKALRTAVIVEKEKGKAKVPAMRGRSAQSDWGPSFGVLFLIVAGSLSGIFTLGFVDPAFVVFGFLLVFLVHAVGAIWGMVNAVQDDEWIALILGYKWLIYMFIESERKWSRSLYLGSLVAGLIGFAIMRFALDTSLDAIISAK